MNYLNLCKLIIIVILLFVTNCFFSCCTIFRKSTQDIPITSDPAGAKVSVGSIVYGKTPTIIKLSRKQRSIVKIELEGYQTYKLTVMREPSACTVWNYVLLGALGIAGNAVDASSGTVCNLNPKNIHARLIKASNTQ